LTASSFKKFSLMACKIRAYYLLAVVLCSVLLNLSRVQAQDQDYSYRENHLLVAGDSLIDFENWDGALNAFFAAESVFDQLEHTPASIHTKGKIAYCYMQQKAYKTAFVYLSKAMAEGDKLPEKDISEICTIYSHLGEYYLKKSQPSLDSSLLAHKRAIEICEKGLPEVNEDLAQAYWGMGWYYYKRDQFLESINYYRKSFEIQEQVLGPDNQQLGITSQWLGISYRNLGDPFRAQDYLKRAIEIFESNYAFSPSHDYVAYTSLANTHFDIKEFEIAQPLYEKALSIGSMSASPQTRISPLNNLA